MKIKSVLFSVLFFIFLLFCWGVLILLSQYGLDAILSNDTIWSNWFFIAVAWLYIVFCLALGFSFLTLPWFAYRASVFKVEERHNFFESLKRSFNESYVYIVGVLKLIPNAFR